MIVQKNIKYYIAVHGLTKVLAVNTKDILMLLHIGFYYTTTRASTDDNPTSQLKLDKRLPQTIQEVPNKFHDETRKFH